jgi:hypothetical protein
MSAYYGTEAIVLSTKDIGEADKKITFYTKELGRIEAIAKSVRTQKSKLRGHLSTFGHVQLLLVSARDNWRLLDANNLDPRYENNRYLKRDFTDFTLKLVGPENADAKVWETIADMNTVKNKGDVAHLKIRLLRALGLFPGVRECSKFFSSHAISFISGKSDASFLSDNNESRLFALGIDKILIANHMS